MTKGHNRRRKEQKVKRELEKKNEKNTKMLELFSPPPFRILGRYHERYGRRTDRRTEILVSNIGFTQSIHKLIQSESFQKCIPDLRKKKKLPTEI